MARCIKVGESLQTVCQQVYYNLPSLLRSFFPFHFLRTASTQRYFWNSVYNFFLDPSESVEFTEFEPFHFRRVRLAAGITDAIYSMYVDTICSF